MLHSWNKHASVISVDSVKTSLCPPPVDQGTQESSPQGHSDKGCCLKVSSSFKGTSTRGTEHGDLCVGGAGTCPYIDPAGGCALCKGTIKRLRLEVVEHRESRNRNKWPLLRTVLQRTATPEQTGVSHLVLSQTQLDERMLEVVLDGRALDVSG